MLACSFYAGCKSVVWIGQPVASGLTIKAQRCIAQLAEHRRLPDLLRREWLLDRPDTIVRLPHQLVCILAV